MRYLMQIGMEPQEFETLCRAYVEAEERYLVLKYEILKELDVVYAGVVRPNWDLIRSIGRHGMSPLVRNQNKFRPKFPE